jgi:hypothetical protein
VLGAELNVKTLYGDIKMKVDPGTQNEEKKKIANYVRVLNSLRPSIGCPKVAPEPSSKREPLCHR